MSASLPNTTEYLYNDGSILTGYPFTLSAWFNTTTNNVALVGIGDPTLGDTFHEIVLNQSAVIRADSRAGGNIGQANITAAYTTGTWNHACCVFTSASSRAAYLNGGNKGTDSTTIGFVGSRTAIGANVDSSATGKYTGLVAQVAIWSVALDDAEVASLGRGFSPLLIRPASLVGYWPLTRNDFTTSAAFDRWRNRHNMSYNTGSGPALGDNPRINDRALW